MINYIKTDITPVIQSFRSELYNKLGAPIDAMWELLYIASAQYYLIQYNGQNIGYCSVDQEASLLQIFIIEDHLHRMNEAIRSLIESGIIKSAKLSSSEPISFNACLFLSKGTKSNTFCYEHLNKPMTIESDLNLELVLSEDIPAIKNFLKEQVGMDDTFGYTENLVARKEIFMLKDSGKIIATSECRMSDSQSNTADLGIIVNRNFQRKGLATQIMKMQVNRVLKANRKPICSTTLDNIASQKAIENSGFYISNIIFDISFTDV